MSQFLASGIASGASYSLLALALVLVLKSTDIPNFAMAEMGLFSTYAAWAAMHHGAPYLVGLLILLGVSLLLGLVAGILVIKRFLGKPHYVTVVVTIALWYLINSVTALIWGPETHSIEMPFSRSLRLGSAVVTSEQVAIVVVMLVVAGLMLLVFRTNLGLQMRAIAMDNVVPRLLGVSINRLSAVAWSMASVIAGLAVFLHAQSDVLSPASGSDLLVGAFVAATLGGFSSIGGAVLGGLVLGVAESFAGAYVSTAVQTGVALVIVLLVLVARPRGLLGETAVREA